MTKRRRESRKRKRKKLLRDQKERRDSQKVTQEALALPKGRGSLQKGNARSSYVTQRRGETLKR
ncbi:hypothetical protein DS745_15595 [Anaerobacillus alkaliphilus]|uniref:Uncharacterized protein n=1 Tax=Anaerobacillus alkaliphilus TaxID=1548597 RepID=A0A4Q0VNW9_9BACI|nr:hypothetical protein DS745_15595 [Anaerobacillus alkaliphilus]